MSIHRIAYLSVPHPALTKDDVTDILAVARSRNARLHLSGLLIHEFGRFIQLLEGPAASIEEVMRSIVRDTRHSGIRIFLKQSGTSRSFERWAMWSDFSRGELTAGEVQARELLQRSALEALAELERDAASHDISKGPNPQDTSVD